MTAKTFGNGVVQAFTFDPVSRLASLGNDLSGTTSDLAATLGMTAGSQIKSTTRTGDAYPYTGLSAFSRDYVTNGLNQYTSSTKAGVTTTYGYDSRGNLISDGTNSFAYTSENLLKSGPNASARTYGYSSENLLTSASGGVTLSYDPALRLYQTVGAATTRFLYDGLDAIAEYNSSNALQRRFVFDPTTGQPVLWYEGTGTAATNRRYLSQDERGSVISVSGSTGVSLGLNTYDDYGKPGASNLGRYQYTGQKWIGEAGIYDYKARDYLPHLGIFAQTDPIGQAGGPNIYAYVFDDPVNWVDPLGLCTDVQQDGGAGSDCPPIVITAPTDHSTPLPEIDPFQGFELAKLNFGQKFLAKGIYATNPQIRKNLRAIVKQYTGIDLTDKEVDKILNDIINGGSTTWNGLGLFQNVGRALTPQQFNTLSIYINGLPNSDLNSRVKSAWSRLKTG